MQNGNFLYDSDAYNDDLPYWVNVNKKKHLVVPYSLDTMMFIFKLLLVLVGQIIFMSMFVILNYLYKEGAHKPKMLNIGLHPRLIGRPGRIVAVEKNNKSY